MNQYNKWEGKIGYLLSLQYIVVFLANPSTGKHSEVHTISI